MSPTTYSSTYSQTTSSNTTGDTSSSSSPTSSISSTPTPAPQNPCTTPNQMLCCPPLNLAWNPMCGLGVNCSRPQPKKITVIRNSYPNSPQGCYPAPYPMCNPYQPNCYPGYPMSCSYPSYYPCNAVPCNPQPPAIVIDPNTCGNVKSPNTYTYYRQRNLATEISPEVNSMIHRVLDAVNGDQQCDPYYYQRGPPQQSSATPRHRPLKEGKEKARRVSHKSTSTSSSTSISKSKPSYSTSQTKISSGTVTLPGPSSSSPSSASKKSGEKWHIQTFDYVKDHHKGEHHDDQRKHSAKKGDESPRQRGSILKQRKESEKDHSSSTSTPKNTDRRPTLENTDRRPTLENAKRRPSLEIAERKTTLENTDRRPTLESKDRKCTLENGKSTPENVETKNDTNDRRKSEERKSRDDGNGTPNSKGRNSIASIKGDRKLTVFKRSSQEADEKDNRKTSLNKDVDGKFDEKSKLRNSSGEGGFTGAVKEVYNIFEDLFKNDDDIPDSMKVPVTDNDENAPQPEKKTENEDGELEKKESTIRDGDKKSTSGGSKEGKKIVIRRTVVAVLSSSSSDIENKEKGKRRKTRKGSMAVPRKS